MSPVIVACVLAACLIPHASVAEERRPTSAPATTTRPVPDEDLCQLHPYDIKNLTRKAYWFTNATVSQICYDHNATSCTLYFSFCKALKLPFNTTNCGGSAVCLVSRDAKGKELHDFSLGQFVMNETQFYETNDTERGSFYVEVKSGNTVPQCNNGFSTRIELVCDPSVQWKTQDLTKNNISNVEVDETCSYKITLHYAGACLPHNPSSTSTSMPMPSPTPTTSSSTTSSVSPTNSSSATVNPTSSSSTTSSVSPTNSTTATVNPTSSSSTTSSVSPTNSTSATVNPTTSSSMTSSSSSSGSTSVTPPTPPGTKTAQTESMTVPASPTVMPTGTPTVPPPHTTTKKPPNHPTHPTHPSTAEPTANPLASKVSGLTAGIVIFALLFFVSLLVVIGLVWYFKFHQSRYHKLPNEDL